MFSNIMLFLLYCLVADGSTLSAQFCRVDLLLRIFRIWNSFDLRSWLSYFIIGKQLVIFLMCIICGKGCTRYLIFLIWKEGGYVSVGYTSLSLKNFALSKYTTASCFLSLLKNCKNFFSLYKFGVLNEARFDVYVVINRVISLSTW